MPAELRWVIQIGGGLYMLPSKVTVNTFQGRVHVAGLAAPDRLCPPGASCCCAIGGAVLTFMRSAKLVSHCENPSAVELAADMFFWVQGFFLVFFFCSLRCCSRRTDASSGCAVCMPPSSPWVDVPSLSVGLL